VVQIKPGQVIRDTSNDVRERSREFGGRDELAPSFDFLPDLTTRMEHQQAQAQAAQSLSRRDASGSGASNPLRRSLHVLAELMPFSSTALASLPKDLRVREREVRADRIPTNSDVREYGATGVTLPPNVRVPKKLATPIKVEGKVWLASERSNHSTRLPVSLT
jgi:hypothetical protein